MGRGKDDFWGSAFFVCLKESCGAEAPTIPRFQSRKAVFRARRGQIIAQIFRQGQKLGRHKGAYGVQALIHWTRVATTIAEKSRERRCAAGFQRAAKNIGGGQFHQSIL